MIAAIYARKSTELNGISDEAISATHNMDTRRSRCRGRNRFREFIPPR